MKSWLEIKICMSRERYDELKVLSEKTSKPIEQLIQEGIENVVKHAQPIT